MNWWKQLFHYLRHDFIKINWDGTITSNDSEEDDFPKMAAQINPATGLLMIGALDSMGNMIGTSSSLDRRHYASYDYYR